MARTNIEQKAIGLLKAFESAGKAVSRVTIEGKKIEIVLSNGESGDEFDAVDMRYGQT